MEYLILHIAYYIYRVNLDALIYYRAPVTNRSILFLYIFIKKRNFFRCKFSQVEKI